MIQVSDILSRLENETHIGVTLFEKNITQYKFVNYKTLHQDALCFAAHLQYLGIEENQPVLIMLPNNYDFVVAFWGCVYSGAIPAAIYPPMKLGALDLWESRTKLLSKSLGAQYIVSQDSIYCLGHKGVGNLKLIETKNRNKNVFIKRPLTREPNDIAFIQFSSGTTSTPKPIVITQKNLLTNSEAILKEFFIKKDRVHSCASWLPLYHDMGLVGAMICSFREKGNFYLLRPEVFLANPAIWFEVINKFRVNFTLAPNFAFDLCQRKISDQQLLKFDLSCLEVILNGAENVSYKTLNDFIHKFLKSKLNPLSIMPVYGMAEATLGVSFSPHLKGPQFKRFNKESLILEGKGIVDKNGVALACLGRPVENVRLKIKNELNEDLEEGLLGEICLKGDSIGPGTFDPIKTIIPHPTTDGFIRTGDQGFLYKEELYLWGRLKDLIIINGKNIDAQYIESQLYELDFIRKGQVMAFSSFDENNFEKLIIICELSKNTIIQDEFYKIIQKCVYSSIGIKPHIIKFFSAGSLPKTSSGKLQRSRAKELWQKNEIKNYNEASKLNILSKVIRGKWKSVLG